MDTSSPEYRKKYWKSTLKGMIAGALSAKGLDELGAEPAFTAWTSTGVAYLVDYAYLLKPTEKERKEYSDESGRFMRWEYLKDNAPLVAKLFILDLTLGFVTRGCVDERLLDKGLEPTVASLSSDVSSDTLLYLISVVNRRGYHQEHLIPVDTSHHIQTCYLQNDDTFGYFYKRPFATSPDLTFRRQKKPNYIMRNDRSTLSRSAASRH